jgi:hypothetical protein
MPISIWWLIPTFVALVGALMLFGGIGRVFKAKFTSGVFRVLFGGVALAGAAIFGLIGLNLQTYAQLTKERLAGQVVLTKAAGADAFTYNASVDLADNGKLRGAPADFEVKGEHLRIEGPVLKWKGWANVLGLDSVFRVDHIEGVYVDTDCQNRFYAGRQDLNEKGGPKDQFSSIRNLGESWKLVNAADVLYIDGPRVPMADGAVYNIKATQAGFELEPDGDFTKNLANRILNDEAARCDADPNAASVGTPANPAPATAPVAAPENPNPVTPTSPPEQLQRPPPQATVSPG